MEDVNCVRKFQIQLPLEEAVESAVEECVKNNILRDFLLKNKAEVISMSIFEYDEELHKETLRKEGYEEGVVEGQMYIIQKMRESGMSLEQIAGIVGEKITAIEKMLSVECK